MRYNNIHTHSTYCDGKDTVEDMITSGIEKNFAILGFSSHAPMPFKNHFAIKNHQELTKYCNEVRLLAQKYLSQIKIYLSLEIDYIPSMTTSFDWFKKECDLDYTIGAVHLVKNNNNDLWFIDGGNTDIYDAGLRDFFDNDIKKAVRTYFDQVNEMISTQRPDMVAHFDKIKMNNNNRFFLQSEQWYVDLINETLDNIKANNCVMEINTRGLYKKRHNALFPGMDIIKKAQRLNIPMSLNTDAHHHSELDGYYKQSIVDLNKIGLSSLWYYDTNQWKEKTMKI